jgi:hypothetical protein
VFQTGVVEKRDVFDDQYPANLSGFETKEQRFVCFVLFSMFSYEGCEGDCCLLEGDISAFVERNSGNSS